MKAIHLLGLFGLVVLDARHVPSHFRRVLLALDPRVLRVEFVFEL